MTSKNKGGATAPTLQEYNKDLTDIGKQAYDKASKVSNETVEIRDLSDNMHKGYMDTLKDTAIKGKKKYTNTFYVVVLTKREKLIAKTMRNYFYARQSCPTPGYEQAVYKFNSKDESLSFLWMVPTKEMCNQMYEQRFCMDLINDPLLPYVVEFIEGGLYRQALTLNGEPFK